MRLVPRTRSPAQIRSGCRQVVPEISYPSERKPQRELQDPSFSGSAGDMCRCRADCIAGENNILRAAEIGVINNVECLRTQLQIVSLRDRYFLEKRGIDIE